MNIWLDRFGGTSRDDFILALTERINFLVELTCDNFRVEI